MKEQPDTDGRSTRIFPLVPPLILFLCLSFFIGQVYVYKDTMISIVLRYGETAMKKIGYPTLDDVLDDILRNVTGDFKEKVKTMTPDEFIVKQHFNLGMTIKEKYFYRNKAQEHLVKSLGLGDKKEYRFFDGDVFSHLILEALWKKITTERLKQS